MKWRELFLTVGYAGKSPIASGTVGSFVALFPGVLIMELLSASTLFLLSILICVLAVKQVDIFEQESGEHDSSLIVIDELCGIWITLALAGSGFLAAILAFFWFRLFDIWKPSIIGRIDRDVGGGWGVMGDDMVAGLFAGLATAMSVGALGYFGIAF